MSNGCIISGGDVDRSVLAERQGREVGQGRGGRASGVRVGRNVVRQAILDKNVIEDGAEIGVNRDADLAWFHVSENGVTVVHKGGRVTAF